jgi:hypothetical protein
MRAPGINDSTRVLLLVMAEHMRDNLTVSVPRKDLARWLNRSEKRIQERIKHAHQAGFLDTVSPGHRGHTAVYAGLFPDADRGTATRALSGAANRTPMKAHSGTPGGPTTPTAETPARGWDCKSSNEEQLNKSRSLVRAAFHRFSDETSEERSA